VESRFAINGTEKGEALSNTHSSRYQNIAGFVTVRRGLLIDLINRLSDKEISCLAQYIAKKETKDFVLLLRNEYNIESSLDVIETWLRLLFV
jgi:hypothetical protein